MISSQKTTQEIKSFRVDKSGRKIASPAKPIMNSRVSQYNLKPSKGCTSPFSRKDSIVSISTTGTSDNQSTASFKKMFTSPMSRSRMTGLQCGLTVASTSSKKSLPMFSQIDNSFRMSDAPTPITPRSENETPTFLKRSKYQKSISPSRFEMKDDVQLREQSSVANQSQRRSTYLACNILSGQNFNMLSKEKRNTVSPTKTKSYMNYRSRLNQISKVPKKSSQKATTI